MTVRMRWRAERRRARGPCATRRRVHAALGGRDGERPKQTNAERPSSARDRSRIARERHPCAPRARRAPRRALRAHATNRRDARSARNGRRTASRCRRRARQRAAAARVGCARACPIRRGRGRGCFPARAAIPHLALIATATVTVTVTAIAAAIAATGAGTDAVAVAAVDSAVDSAVVDSIIVVVVVAAAAVRRTDWHQPKAAERMPQLSCRVQRCRRLPLPIRRRARRTARARDARARLARGDVQCAHAQRARALARGRAALPAAVGLDLEAEALARGLRLKPRAHLPAQSSKGHERQGVAARRRDARGTRAVATTAGGGGRVHAALGLSLIHI